MSDEDTTAPETETAPETPTEPDQLPDNHPLVKTLAAQKAQIRELKEKAARLDQIERDQLSKEERIAAEAADALDRANRAEAEALRWRIAARYGISDEDAELFLTAADEETLAKQAERFQLLSSKPPKGTHVPGVGNQPTAPASIAEQIQAAEKAGDVKLAIALKSQQLAEIARNNR